jgi:hypothetical protein
MKHILNNLTEEEKKSIREQHTGGIKIVNENFSKLIKATLGDSKPLVSEQYYPTDEERYAKAGYKEDMKNIHVLPTDKPGRLHFDGKLFLSTNPQISREINSIVEGRNIYITSDEEIKEGDWFTDNNNSLKRSYKLSHVQFANPKKIILTTDDLLIKDGVQAIDDEFLEWFVKNPSCESVQVDKNWNYPLDKNWEYKIIIPKEEHKQETLEV